MKAAVIGCMVILFVVAILLQSAELAFICALVILVAAFA